MVSPQLVPARPEASGEITTLLGRGASFEGKLTFEGTVRIDGRLTGEVFSDDVLVIGEGAEIHAEIEVGTVIVQGTAVRNIRAKHGVELRAPGVVRGNVSTPSLAVERGVVFDGQCTMTAR